jgi:hypothetical protein
MGSGRTILPAMSWGSWVGPAKVLFVLAFAAGNGLAVQAQETPQACSVIADDGERLACYDALFRDRGGERGEVAEAVVLDSERLIPARPTGRAPATMTVECSNGAVLVSFAFANQLVSNTSDIAAVTLQVDQNATAVRTLRASADNTTLSFAAGRESQAFLDSLEGGTSLKVRMTPVRQRSVTVDFRLPEHIAAIEAIRQSCGES